MKKVQIKTARGETGATTLKPVAELKTGRRDCKRLRKFLEASGRSYICEWCKCEEMTLNDGEWEWQGKKLSLEIDHIHGVDGTDHQDRLENLRFLCPSCHSQTKNYGSGGDLENEATTVSNE